MPYYTYSVVHNGKGDFLIFRKNNRGYFFHRAGGGGSIIVAGQVLNGAGNYAFPGGKPDNQVNVVNGAIEEMEDETGVDLTDYPTNPASYYQHTPDGEYYGVYFYVGDNIDDIEEEALANLAIGANAAQGVIDGRYLAGQYAQLMTDYPGCPADNELAHFVRSWNLFAQWDEIEALNAPPTDWFYNIIINLYNVLFPVHIYNQDNELIGIAREMALGVDNLYTTDCILYNADELLQYGVYRIMDGDDEYARMGLNYLGAQQGIAQFRQL